MIHHLYPQGSEPWLAARRGVVTGSRFKDCRDFKAPTAAQKKDGVTRGEPSSKLLCYAYDVARERLGGRAPEKFQNAAMRLGTEQEAPARLAYERRTGNLVEEVGFFTTDDGVYGLSPDGLIDDDGVLEIKTMVSSDTLFTAVACGDISEYMDQCMGYLWLLGRKWVDLCLWVPDLGHLTIRRIERDENAIERLEADLVDFAGRVKTVEDQLRKALSIHVPGETNQGGVSSEEAAPSQHSGVASTPPAIVPVAAAPASTVVQATFAAPLQPEKPALQLVPAGPPTLNLGAINQRIAPLGITVSGLEKLGFPVAGKQGAASLYHESSFPAMVKAMADHLVLALSRKDAA